MLQLRDKRLCRRRTLCWLFGQSVQQGLFNGERKIRIDLPWRRGRRDDVLDGCGVGRFCAKGQLPGEELVGDDGQAVVIARGFGFSLGLLGSHIFGRTNAHARLGKMLLIGENPRNAEVGQQEPVIAAQEHVAGFNVTM